MSDLREQLIAIRTENGRLTPQLVVDAARPKKSLLHSKFEWDNGIAAESYRRVQAAELIRSVRVTYLPLGDGPQASIRAFHATARPEIGHAYDPIEEIMDNPIQRAILLRDMERDWRALKKRYESIVEFWDLLNSEVSEAV
jgi:hypothetical protein